MSEVKNMSVLDQLKKLDEQRAKLMADAKAEALAKAEAAVADLNAIGFSYRLVEGDGAPKAKRQQRQKDPNEPCKTCNFVTAPPHDSRRHRAQGEAKKPFTVKELEALGLKKV